MGPAAPGGVSDSERSWLVRSAARERERVGVRVRARGEGEREGEGEEETRLRESEAVCFSCTLFLGACLPAESLAARGAAAVSRPLIRVAVGVTRRGGAWSCGEGGRCRDDTLWVRGFFRIQDGDEAMRACRASGVRDGARDPERPSSTADTSLSLSLSLSRSRYEGE